ncbi:MAG TPA: cation-translocating P-type ATPase, partial [Sphingobacteriaceae bacterium]
LLKALTLAMSILPEEIPVAFTTFMALGAWRLMKKGIIVKGTQTVETLGSATVICTDKTGTITENRMHLAHLYLPGAPSVYSEAQWPEIPDALPLIEAAMWASEPVPFDPMEIALHKAYQGSAVTDRRNAFKMVHEYPLSGKPPMMTHVFENGTGERIIAAKGAPEAILNLVSLSVQEKEHTLQALEGLQKEGFRVLAVATSGFSGSGFPEHQQQLPFQFRGLVAFYDPPKHNIDAVFKQFYQAGIAVKIITGDNALTTSTIARQVGFKGAAASLEGEQLVNMTDQQLDQEVNRVNVFTRMFPEAKLRIIESLKRNGHIVAMTGDGVNDGPALKAAHIGIAMGKRGSETARQSSSLILVDDDLGKMVDAVTMGRKIYSNLKKAIQYIISIHIPIILTVTLPLLLGWLYPNIFTPVHVIFLELIMGPTCSIAYENEPAESHIMLQPPRTITRTFLSWKELSLSVWQGLIISAGALLVYQYAVQAGYGENIVRTMVFTNLVTANIFLTLVNRSFYISVLNTFSYRNWLLRGMILLTIVLLFVLIEVPALREFFKFERITWHQFLIPLAVSFVSVIWFEGYKWFNRRKLRLTPAALRI